MTTDTGTRRGSAYRMWAADHPDTPPARRVDRWWPVFTVTVVAAGAVIVAAGLHLWAIIGWALR